jgi:TPR repeat protein
MGNGAKAGGAAATCEEGSAVACDELGVRYEQGRGVDKDDARAASLFAKACEMGHAEGCLHAAMLQEQSHGADGPDVQALILYTMACEGGVTEACAHLSDGGGKDEARAAEISAGACEKGDLRACAALAERLEEGRGVETNLLRAAELYAKGCDGGNALSCYRLGMLIDAGNGVVKQDKARAMTLFKKACAADQVNACVSFHNGACNGGDATSCFDLAILYDAGRGVQQDRERALELFSKACKGGYASGCVAEKLKTRYETIVKGLAKKGLPACKDAAPDDAARTTTLGARAVAGAPALPDSDLNVSMEPSGALSRHFKALASATGGSWIEKASELLSVPATLVIDVEAETPAVLISGDGSGGRYRSGSLTARQVRFDSAGKAVCEKRATAVNSRLELEQSENLVEGARAQLRGRIALSF